MHVIATGRDEVVFEVAETRRRRPRGGGLDVLYDDRPKVSPGVKFGDAELLGVPTIVIVGRGAADGVVELWDRRTGERTRSGRRGRRAVAREIAARLAGRGARDGSPSRPPSAISSTGPTGCVRRAAMSERSSSPSPVGRRSRATSSTPTCSARSAGEVADAPSVIVASGGAGRRRRSSRVEALVAPRTMYADADADDRRPISDQRQTSHGVACSVASTSLDEVDAVEIRAGRSRSRSTRARSIDRLGARSVGCPATSRIALPARTIVSSSCQMRERRERRRDDRAMSTPPASAARATWHPTGRPRRRTPKAMLTTTPPMAMCTIPSGDIAEPVGTRRVVASGGAVTSTACVTTYARGGFSVRAGSAIGYRRQPSVARFASGIESE